jgi:GR25 family glycosyltransferase involved in LPS biosynthesis
MKAFVINLSKISSSATSGQAVYKQLLEYGFDAELFEGTYGNEAINLFRSEGRIVHPFGIKSVQISEEELLKVKEVLLTDPYQNYDIQIYKRAPLGENEYGRMTRPGVLGCFYSHFRLWQKCVELDEPIFIFEDDVIFKRPYIPVEWQDVLIVALGKELYKTKYADVFENPPEIPTALAFTKTSMPGAVGYGIKPHAAKKLVETYQSTVLAADNAINQFEVKIEIHSHIIGRAALAEDGKHSLTAGGAWAS